MTKTATAWGTLPVRFQDSMTLTIPGRRQRHYNNHKHHPDRHHHPRYSITKRRSTCCSVVESFSPSNLRFTRPSPSMLCTSAL